MQVFGKELSLEYRSLGDRELSCIQRKGAPNYFDLLVEGPARYVVVSRTVLILSFGRFDFALLRYVHVPLGMFLWKSTLGYECLTKDEMCKKDGMRIYGQVRLYG